eukprot:757675-Hanusia_phi.AAC.2
MTVRPGVAHSAGESRTRAAGVREEEEQQQYLAAEPRGVTVVGHDSLLVHLRQTSGGMRRITSSSSSCTLPMIMSISSGVGRLSLASTSASSCSSASWQSRGGARALGASQWQPREASERT